MFDECFFSCNVGGEHFVEGIHALNEKVCEVRDSRTCLLLKETYSLKSRGINTFLLMKCE